MKVHFIAIGGSAMHNLAIALHKKGMQVTGSDDEIFEPSKGRLNKHGLLPEKMGWDTNRVTADIDAVILGMHAREDNPELQKARELGLKIYSYPEYIYEQSKDKKRIVVGGSHGKTSITAMILHVLQHTNIDFDYMVGAQLEGFDTMVKITDAPIIILEGDEYLSSPIDRRPKFHLYKANVALLSGIAWDHINVFPTYEEYVKQFDIYLETIEPEGCIIYCREDPEVVKVVGRATHPERKIPYGIPKHNIENGTTILDTLEGKVPIQVFGKHNLQNLEGARMVCEQMGIEAKTFYEAIQSFTGAAKRLELVDKNEHTAVYKDFAHSPSKLKATTQAVKNQYSNRELIACMELHTFSSLNEHFLKEYAGAMDAPDEAIVYFNPHTIEHKKLPPVTEEQVKESFARPDIQVFTDSAKLQHYLKAKNWKDKNLLMMSSGNFDEIDFANLAKELINP